MCVSFANNTLPERERCGLITQPLLPTKSGTGNFSSIKVVEFLSGNKLLAESAQQDSLSNVPGMYEVARSLKYLSPNFACIKLISGSVRKPIAKLKAMYPDAR